jgi:hypothetical protein
MLLFITLPRIYSTGRTAEPVISSRIVSRPAQKPKTPLAKSIPVAAGILAKKGQFEQQIRLKEQLRYLYSALTASLEHNMLHILNLNGITKNILENNPDAPLYVKNTLIIAQELPNIYTQIHQKYSSFPRYYQPISQQKDILSNIKSLKSTLEKLSREYFALQKPSTALPLPPFITPEKTKQPKTLVSPLLEEINIKINDVLSALQEEIFYLLVRENLTHLISSEPENVEQIKKDIKIINQHFNYLPETSSSVIRNILNLYSYSIDKRQPKAYLETELKRINIFPIIKNINLRTALNKLLTKTQSIVALLP